MDGKNYNGRQIRMNEADGGGRQDLPTTEETEGHQKREEKGFLQEKEDNAQRFSSSAC